MAIYRELANDSSASEVRLSVAYVRMSLGLLLLERGEPEKAEVECRSALEVIEKTAADNPSFMTLRNGVPFALYHLGDVLRSLGQPAEARDLYQRMITMTEPPVREFPEDPAYLYKLVCAIWRRGKALGDLGDPAGAAADVRRAVRLSDGVPPRTVRYLYAKACSQAALAGLAGRAGSGVSLVEGGAAADKAVEWLRRAVSVGYRNVNELRTESALDPLRSRDDFRLLMMDLAFPADTFRAETSCHLVPDAVF